MKNTPIGISDIGLHIPSPRIDLEKLVEERVRENPGLERHLARALRTTGQTAIRYPSPWEDPATMAAEAVARVLKGADIDVRSMRHFSVGTETGLDHSKPLSAYVQGMLQRAGCALPATLSSMQVQHACAGGTMAMLGVAGLLAAAGREGESGLVACSDIARYQVKSTAEITQGAGAAALIVESSPRLVEIDLPSIGYCSRDVDDFFRPLGSSTPEVNGSYSMKCYAESLDAALLDHCGRIGQLPSDALRSTDYLVLHTPFRNMPEAAMKKLLARHLDLDEEQAVRFLREKGLYDGIDPLARIGNLYTASLYTALAFLLERMHRVLGHEIVGKKILFASYGSGSTMIVFSGTVAAGAPQVIARWGLGRLFLRERATGFPEYEAWAQGAAAVPGASVALPPAGSFCLTGIREDGYREYARTGEQADWLTVRGLDRGEPVAATA
jgi:hydroxymethylglutaryl-CoA synthase